MLRGTSGEISLLSFFPLRARFSCLILGIAAFVFGCSNPAPTNSRQSRAITREMVVAAQAATGGRAKVTSQPQRAAKESEEGAADRIFITLPVERDGQPDVSVVPAIELQLDRVARAHRLRRVPRNSSPRLHPLRLSELWPANFDDRDRHSPRPAGPAARDPRTQLEEPPGTPSAALGHNRRRSRQ